MNFDFGRTAIVGEAEAVPTSPFKLRTCKRLHPQVMREIGTNRTAMPVRPRVHTSVRLFVAVIPTATQLHADPLF